MNQHACGISTLIIVIITAVPLSVRAESGPARIEHLGDFEVSDVSADGRVVVGTGGGSAGLELVRWEAGTPELLGKFTEHTFASGVSGDGKVVVGADYNTQGVRWTRQAGLEHFGGGPANDASFDGSVVIGSRYRWTAGGGFTPLTPNEALEATPYRMNGDGSVLVGTGRDGSHDVAFRWTATTGVVFLPDLPAGGKPHDAAAVTPDGSVVVGTAYLPSPSFSTSAFRWSADTGSQPIPHLPNHDPGSVNSSIATAVTADGLVVFGHEPVGGPAFGHEAFVWDAANGTRPLKNVLQSEYGIDLTGWTLETIRSLSSDGTTLVGNGSHPVHGNAALAWMVSAFMLLMRRAAQGRTDLVSGETTRETHVDGVECRDNGDAEQLPLPRQAVRNHNLVACGPPDAASSRQQRLVITEAGIGRRPVRLARQMVRVVRPPSPAAPPREGSIPEDLFAVTPHRYHAQAWKTQPG